MNSVNSRIFDQAKHAVIDLDEQAVERIAIEALEVGINPVDLIEKGFVKAMKELGDSFEAGKAELAQIFEAYQIVETGIDILRSTIIDSKSDVSWFGNLIVEPDAKSTSPFVSHAHATDALTSFYCC